MIVRLRLTPGLLYYPHAEPNPPQYLRFPFLTAYLVDADTMPTLQHIKLFQNYVWTPLTPQLQRSLTYLGNYMSGVNIGERKDIKPDDWTALVGSRPWSLVSPLRPTATNAGTYAIRHIWVPGSLSLEHPPEMHLKIGSTTVDTPCFKCQCAPDHYAALCTLGCATCSAQHAFNVRKEAYGTDTCTAV